MNITTRIRRIEDSVFNKQTDKMVVIVEEINGKYYTRTGEKLEEVALSENDPDVMYIIMKSCKN